MLTYSVLQWFLFFYIYCFLGWIWETLYVSVGIGRWVNRGFMRGPFLPIYGFGATGMVLLTIPLQGNHVLEFVIGMIGATVMEYFTGVAMESMFHVRYWDYSKCFCNLRGYICLKASLCWGMFGILVPTFIHVQVERLVLSIPQNTLEFLVLILTALIAADFSESFKEAMDFKEILINLSQKHEELARLEQKVTAVSGFVNGELKEKSEEGLKKINSTLNVGKQKYQENKEHLVTNVESMIGVGRNAMKRSYQIIHRNPDMISVRYAQALADMKEFAKNKRNRKK